MSAMQKKMEVNPHYVSRLIGPLALATEMDSQGEVLGSINYSDSAQGGLVVRYLIQPTFDRLNEPTKQEVKKSLGYLVANHNRLSELIEEKLLLCGVPPESFAPFLLQLWNSLFPEEALNEYAAENCRVLNKPLTANQFVFNRQVKNSLQNMLNELHAHLLSL